MRRSIGLKYCQLRLETFGLDRELERYRSMVWVTVQCSSGLQREMNNACVDLGDTYGRRKAFIARSCKKALPCHAAALAAQNTVKIGLL